MKFLWHPALWLMLALPALAAAYVARRRRRRDSAIRYSSFALVSEAMTRGSRMRPHVPAIIFFVGFAALIVSIARPAFFGRAASGKATVVLLMDVSLSMAASDVPPTRLDAAREAAKRFVRAQPDDVQIAVVAFGAHAEVVQPPTTSRDSVLAALERLQLQRFTAIGNGLIGALLTIAPDADVPQGYDIFRSGTPPARSPSAFGAATLPDNARLEKRRRTPDPPGIAAAIILVSDGRGTMGIPADQAAKLVAAFGIRVYTVGVGTLYGGVANVEGWPAIHAEFEEDTLRRIADITGGDYFLARDASKLERVYDTLGRRAIFETGTHELTAYLAMLGALLTLAGAALSLWRSAPVAATDNAKRGVMNAK